MSRSILLCCLVAVAVGIVSADEPSAIVNGQMAANGEFPYQVSLRSYNHHFCGGSIISNRFILTAAHCLHPRINKPLNDFTVVSGTNHIKNGGQSHAVANFFVHPQYNPGVQSFSWYYDIAIVQLAAPMTFNRFQNVIALPRADAPRNVRAVLSGWGNDAAPPKGRATPYLMKAVLPLITTAECQKRHRAAIYDSMICTLTPVNYGACNGDSGGPLVYGNQVIGVVSGGIPCALGFPDIFTNVYTYLPWIHNIMNNN